jgi:hypothetical protein
MTNKEKILLIIEFKKNRLHEYDLPLTYILFPYQQRHTKAEM